MAEAHIQASDQFVAQIAAGDLKPLCADLLKLKCAKHSPLGSLLANRKGTAKKLSAAAKDVAQNVSATRALAILAKPKVLMRQRSGGGVRALIPFSACHAPDIDAQAVAVISPSTQASYIVQLFDSPWSYLAWWLNLNASRSREAVANYLPPPLSIETFVYALHAIDSFGRASLSDMLEHARSASASVTPEAFGKSLKTSLASRDLRWLLPAFLTLTPGLDLSKFDEGAKHLGALVARDILLPTKAKGRSKGALAFGEAGRVMGLEFANSWFGAVGFEIAVIEKGRLQIRQRGFLAPTALTNHLCLIEDAAGKALTVNHQALDRDGLDTRMARMLAAVISTDTEAVEADEPPVDEGARPAPIAAPELAEVSVGKFCGQCGEQLRAGAKFCGSCGATIRAS